MSDVAYLQTLVILLLLLVDYAKPKINFICLLEIRLHVHDLRKSFFGMFERSIAIVEDADAVPKFWFLVTLSAKNWVIMYQLPLDLEDGIMLVDKQHKPAVGPPS